MLGKIIVIEGTDCSGKETQSKLLLDKLLKQGYKVKTYGFPNYEEGSGKIVGGPLLGKKEIGKSFFKEGSSNVDYKVSALYFAADRLYNIKKIIKDLEDGFIVILDRYTYSNMAYQGCKIKDKQKRENVYRWIDDLEFNMLGLPKADIKILLYMDYEYSKILMNNRKSLDNNEKDDDYLKNASKSYLEVAKLYDFKIIDCVENGKIRDIDNINKKLFDYVLKNI